MEYIQEKYIYYNCSLIRIRVNKIQQTIKNNQLGD